MKMTKSRYNSRIDYNRSALSETDLPTDPVSLFSKWYDQTMEAEVPEPDAMILSTANAGGVVSARVVLLRGVENGRFLFFTGYGSRKGRDLAANPRAALTFFWQPLERQVRVEGVVSKLTRKASVAYFNSRPLESRVSASISPQSAVIPDRTFLEAMREGFLRDLGDGQPECPPDWGGYGLKPNAVEFWQGRAHRLHDRIRYRLHGRQWVIERLAP